MIRSSSKNKFSFSHNLFGKESFSLSQKKSNLALNKFFALSATNRKTVIMHTSSDDSLLGNNPINSEENLTSGEILDGYEVSYKEIDVRSLLYAEVDYNNLINIPKGTSIIQNLISEAILKNNTSVSITLFNKDTVRKRSNYTSMTFVKAGKKSVDFQSLPYIHESQGEGRIYPTLGDALKVNNLTFSQYYYRLRKKISDNNSLVIVPLTDREKDLLDRNLLNPMSQIQDMFPKDILHGSLLGDGFLKPKQLNPAFSLMQAASPPAWKNGLQHISYLLFVFSKIPPKYFGGKPLFLYMDKKGFWKLVLTTCSFPLLDFYYKTFYPKGTVEKSGFKEIPTFSYLKSTIVTDYKTVAHLILQNGGVLESEISIVPCPISYKGTDRIALVLTAVLSIPCFVRTYKDENYSGGFKHTIVIIRAGMENILNETRDLMALMPYKNLTLKPPYKLGIYAKNRIKAHCWYDENISQPWVETNEM